MYVYLDGTVRFSNWQRAFCKFLVNNSLENFSYFIHKTKWRGFNVLTCCTVSIPHVKSESGEENRDKDFLLSIQQT